MSEREHLVIVMVNLAKIVKELWEELYLGSVQTNKERRQSSSGWRLHLCFEDDDLDNYFDDDDADGFVDVDDDGEEDAPVCGGNNHPAPGKKATVGGVHRLRESLQGQVDDETDKQLKPQKEGIPSKSKSKNQANINQRNLKEGSSGPALRAD